MTCPECIAVQHDYVDGELASSEARAVETHLAQCPTCRAQVESLRALIARAAALPAKIAPRHDLWRGIEFEVERLHGESPHPAMAGAIGLGSSRSTFAVRALRWLGPVAVAASIVFLATFAEHGLRRSDDRHAWSITNIAGAPRVDAKTFERETKFRVGQWLETDDISRAKVAVGNIGEVTVDPNSRLRLVGMASTDHRLELARGSMSASIYAPPRLFFVDTPSATAVDLGCSYTLAVDEEGNGELHVSVGYVALEHGDRESIIRMGMKCLTRRGAGPGTPFADDAPEALRAALFRFDFERDGARTTLPDILAHARTGDAITLWHLLVRTTEADRAAVFEKLAAVSPPPPGVTREGILAGEAEMRAAWGADLGLGVK